MAPERAALEIREQDLAPFLAAPLECYPPGAYFDSQMAGDFKRALDHARNPLFRDFARRTWFTAHRGGKVCGRIVAHVHDASNRLHGLRRGYFGYFDCVDDGEVAAALLAAAARWLKERGCDEMAGSFNLTITQVIGVVTDGFERAPYTYQSYTPPYLAARLREQGFSEFFPMRTFELDVRACDPARLLGERQQKLLRDPAWRFEPIRRRGFERRLTEACAVLNDGFARNAMFTPLTVEEFLFPCDGMMWIIDQTLSWTAYERDAPVGVLLCIPDLTPLMRATGYRLGWTAPWHLLRYRFTRRRAAIIFFAVRTAQQNRGVNGVLLHRCVEALRAGGYDSLGVSWVSDSNAASLRQMERLGAAPLHRLHLFRRPL
jgi:hypothetical protein